MKSLTGAQLAFERDGRHLVMVERDAVVRVEVESAATTRVVIDGAHAVACLGDETWVTTRDHDLVRIDGSGRRIGAPHPLAFAAGGELLAAPCGPPAAAWTSAPPVLLLVENGALVERAQPRAEAIVPLGHHRVATIVGARVTLPSGQVAALAPLSTVVGACALADGKALVLATMCSGGRQLVVISLTTAQLGTRCTLPAADVRIAGARGLALVRAEPRVVCVLDLRTGRELGALTLDGDASDFAVDPAGRTLAVRAAAGELQVIDLATALRGSPSTTPRPHAPLRAVPAALPREARAHGASSAAITGRGRYTRGQFALPDTTDDVLELRSPATREVIGVFPLGADDVDDAVASATEGLSAWTNLSVEARLAVVARIAPALAQRADELASALQRELGRPGWECARELAGLAPRLADTCAHARTRLVDEACGAAALQPRAHGVVALVTPVMLPLATAHAQLIAALVAGNTVVWKPSSLAAASAQVYVDALAAAGLPPGVVNLVQGTAVVGRRLVAHADLGAVIFIGSREHAREVRRATCERLDLPVLLHAGAKNPALVLPGADLERAAVELATSALLSSGQRATAIGRVLVTAAQHEPLVAALTAQLRRLAAAPQLAGPLASAERVDRHFARLHAAVAEGARVVVRPESRPDSLFVGPSMHVVEERGAAPAYLADELFGPDLAVEPVAAIDDALARLRDHHATVAAVYTASPDELARCAQVLHAGAVVANHAPSALSGRLSFAARGLAERGPGAVHGLTRRQALVPEAPPGAHLPHWLGVDLVPVARAAGGAA